MRGDCNQKRCIRRCRVCSESRRPNIGWVWHYTRPEVVNHIFHDNNTFEKVDLTVIERDLHIHDRGHTSNTALEAPETIVIEIKSRKIRLINLGILMILSVLLRSCVSWVVGEVRACVLYEGDILHLNAWNLTENWMSLFQLSVNVHLKILLAYPCPACNHLMRQKN